MRTLLLCLLVQTACSSSAPAAPGAGGVNGTIMGNGFAAVPSAHWIGTSPPGETRLFIFDTAVGCSAIMATGWDKGLSATAQVFEFAMAGTMARAYNIATDADANYLRGDVNPSADGGSITLTVVNAGRNVAGTFDLMFQSDHVTGTFDAAYCANGVEP
jgi:hypothetical protein